MKNSFLLGLGDSFWGPLVISFAGTLFSLFVLVTSLNMNNDLGESYLTFILNGLVSYSTFAIIVGALGSYGIFTGKTTFVKIYRIFYVYIDNISSLLFVIFFPVYFFGNVEPILEIVCKTLDELSLSQESTDCYINSVNVKFIMSWASTLFWIMFIVKAYLSFEISRYCRLILDDDSSKNTAYEKL